VLYRLDTRFSMPEAPPRTVATDIVEVRSLRKVYDEMVAIDDVSFTIHRGEIFGLLGPNGAGKTTTISILASIVPATDGEVSVAGMNPRDAAAPLKRALGMVPQELAIYTKLTAQENLQFFGQLFGMREPELGQRVSEMLDLVGLTDRKDSRADTYSGGMKRRLNLAAGLMHNPQILLLDEPTVGVDPQSRNHIFEGVRKLNQQGMTILYTSHYMEEVESLCDRVGIMDRGKLIACDTVQNLIRGLGGAVIEVGVRSAPAPELLIQLRRIEGVESVELADTKIPAEADGADGSGPTDSIGAKLLVRGDQPNRILPGLVSELTASGVPLLSLAIKEPNLEDVFLSLTGKHLRD
jgi:ABC-2 type transport system ATP-binding protein